MMMVHVSMLEEFADCNGNCLSDFDFDNVCDEL